MKRRRPNNFEDHCRSSKFLIVKKALNSGQPVTHHEIGEAQPSVPDASVHNVGSKGSTSTNCASRSGTGKQLSSTFDSNSALAVKDNPSGVSCSYHPISCDSGQFPSGTTSTAQDTSIIQIDLCSSESGSSDRSDTEEANQRDACEGNGSGADEDGDSSSEDGYEDQHCNPDGGGDPDGDGDSGDPDGDGDSDVDDNSDGEDNSDGGDGSDEGEEDGEYDEDDGAAGEDDVEDGEDNGENVGEDGGEDDSDEDGDPDDPDPDFGRDEDPLFPECPVTLGESMISLMTLFMTYNLSQACRGDILRLLSMHFPRQSPWQRSVHMFKKYFEAGRCPLNRLYYCADCFSSLESKDAICENCGENKGVNYFLHIPIISQLQILFKRPGFFESLRHRFTRVKIHEENLEDLYDGSVYRELSEEGNILFNAVNFSLTWSSDGLKLFRGSKNAIWTFFLSINELPLRLRATLDNVILAGLWFGVKKPLPNLFLQPIRNELQRLMNGLHFTVSGIADPVFMRGIVICGTCDLAAKAMFLNMKQWNGAYGCQKCKIRGVQMGTRRVYPFLRNLQLRTDEETIQFAREAFQTGRAVFGVKGPTLISGCVHRPIRTTVVDYMHALLLNVMKLLCKIWFDREFNNDHPASLFQFLRVIDQRLLAITPPDYANRLPRSIGDHFAYWKASEMKAFLFYYSVPVLSDLLLQAYVRHYNLLVLGSYLLCQPSISPVMINRASEYLTEFVARFEDLYGRIHMTCNIHQLLHLPDVVREFGPLFVTSCFPFEHLNGILKKLVTGSRYPDLQIYQAASVFLKLCQDRREKLRQGGDAENYCNRLSSVFHRFNLWHISEECSGIGKLSRLNNLPLIIQRALRAGDINGTNFFAFDRLFKSNNLFTSQSYNRRAKTYSSCVKFMEDGVGRHGFVQSYLRVSDCHCRRNCNCEASFYAIIRILATENVFRTMPGAVLSFIHRSRFTDEYVAISVENLVSVCYFIRILDRNETYVVEAVNFIEPE